MNIPQTKINISTLSHTMLAVMDLAIFPATLAQVSQIVEQFGSFISHIRDEVADKGVSDEEVAKRLKMLVEKAKLDMIMESVDKDS